MPTADRAPQVLRARHRAEFVRLKGAGTRSRASAREDTVLLLAWEAGRDRPRTVGGPLHAVAHMARMLREAAQHAPLRPPWCDACRTPLDLPPA